MNEIKGERIIVINNNAFHSTQILFATIGLTNFIDIGF